MQTSKRLKITDVNPHLICVLCGGYYIDATTIIECLHSFCRSCLVKYLEKNKYCPICDVQIHKHFPLLSIRRDRTLQNIVYKLVPSLFKNEMQRRQYFYCKHRVTLPRDPEARGEVPQNCPIILPEEKISVCLEYYNGSSSLHGSKRYFQCPALLTVSHLQKLIRGKFGLTPTQQVNFFFKEEPLREDQTLMDLGYAYTYKRGTALHLFYRISELRRKRIKVIAPPAEEESKVTLNKSEKEKEGEEEWKEVQLEISENGVMSARQMDSDEGMSVVNRCVPSSPEERAPKETTTPRSPIEETSRCEEAPPPSLSPSQMSTSLSSPALPPPSLSSPSLPSTTVSSALPSTPIPSTVSSALPSTPLPSPNVSSALPSTPLSSTTVSSALPSTPPLTSTTISSALPSTSLPSTTVSSALPSTPLPSTTVSSPPLSSPLLSSPASSHPPPTSQTPPLTSVSGEACALPSPSQRPSSAPDPPVPRMSSHPSPSSHYALPPKTEQPSITVTKVPGLHKAKHSAAPESPKSKTLQKGEALDKIVKRLIPNSPVPISPKSPSHNPKAFRYKTLRTPTKPWNPTLDRNTALMLRAGSQSRSSDKEPRFFKGRQLGGREEGGPPLPVPPPDWRHYHSPLYSPSSMLFFSTPLQRVSAAASKAPPLPPPPLSPSPKPPPISPFMSPPPTYFPHFYPRSLSNNNYTNNNNNNAPTAVSKRSALPVHSIVSPPPPP